MNRKIFKNFRVKVISVLFAITLWYFITNEKERQISFNVPLALSMPEEVGISPGKVRVTLRGKFSQILKLDPRTIRINGVSVSQSLGDLDTATLEIKSNNVFVPSGFQVVSVKPSVVELRRKGR